MNELNLTRTPANRGQESTNVGLTPYQVNNLDVAGVFVPVVASSTWIGPTGTASRATFATYNAPTVSNPPTQAEVQAVADALQTISRHMKALIDDLKAAGAI
jgi:hypothetical protein